ncbi:hypothetical protein PG984_004795 [Apiospora sp. TS-2023a]
MAADGGKEVVVVPAHRPSDDDAHHTGASRRRRTLLDRTWRKGVAKARGLSFALEKCEDRFLVHPARRLGRTARSVARGNLGLLGCRPGYDEDLWLYEG